MSLKKNKSLNSLIKGSIKIEDDDTEIKPKVKSKINSKIELTKKSIDPKDTTESELTDSDEIDSTYIKVNELIYPCKDKILYTKISLFPHQMNNDLYINLKKNLMDNIEGKCIKDGYVIKVYKILEYFNGIIEPENFTGSAIFNIKYLAKICFGLKNSMIIANIADITPNANFVLVEFGNIMKIIFTKSKRDMNSKNFILGNDKSIIYLPNQTILKKGDYIKIQLNIIKYYQNDTCIKCMGYLEDIATPDEIAEYAYKNDTVFNNIKNETSSTIYFNDDNDTVEDNIEKTSSNIMYI